MLGQLHDIEAIDDAGPGQLGHGQVDFRFEDLPGQGLGVVHLHRDLQSRVPLDQPGNREADRDRRGIGAHPDPQRPGLAAQHEVDVAPRLLCLPQERAGVSDHALPERGRRHAAPAAIEQPPPEVGLKDLKAPGQSGLAQRQLARRLGEIPFLGDRDDLPQPFQVQIHASSLLKPS